ncbi:MAG TPA: DUF4214 domain-containing protein [Noviherbaspirillum sp.]|jgi:hypothetical protein|uniref:DUF4214 domain-containing protein n=1 Tax=Noviherbaspirillum sp. TaxID=1926288 RepID=UPI002DDCBE61|nr:DUF4214 domain-containing protein [Noviherbaspirillum sp.]HEV2612061.1 DUF4214 domain-containing protein [Noviherbaspirillum sp.]
MQSSKPISKPLPLYAFLVLALAACGGDNSVATYDTNSPGIITTTASPSLAGTTAPADGKKLMPALSAIDVMTMPGSYRDYSVIKSGIQYAATHVSGNSITISSNIKRLSFSDGFIALDINGNAGQAYRLYQAAFGRKPDLSGLSVQIRALDQGVSPLQISENFMYSQEFSALYGDTLTNAAFITQLYRNVLRRAPDQAGFDHWTGLLNTFQLSRFQVLYAFSESDENRARVLADIQHGIFYSLNNSSDVPSAPPVGETQTMTLAGGYRDYVIVKSGAQYVARHATGDTIAIPSSINRLVFSDGAIALDISGNAGQAYRLYQAAFNRKPDRPGLGVQTNALDQGISPVQISENFMTSKEFTDLYGINLSHAAFITQLYRNVLHREPEQAGFDHWMQILRGNQLSRAQVLYAFSESDENRTRVLADIQNGILYMPIGVAETPAPPPLGETPPSNSAPQPGSTAATGSIIEGLWTTGSGEPGVPAGMAFIDNAGNYLGFQDIDVLLTGAWTLSASNWSFTASSRYNMTSGSVPFVMGLGGSGTVTPRSRFDGVYGAIISSGSEPNKPITQSYSNANALAVTQADMTGTWATTEKSIVVSPEGTLTGRFTGNGFGDCVLQGSIIQAAPGTSKNMFTISVTPSSGPQGPCNLNPEWTYTGYAALTFTNVSAAPRPYYKRSVTFVVEKFSRWFAGELVKS